MAPVPKRKISHARKRRRMFDKNYTPPEGVECSLCKKLKHPHRTCAYCTSSKNESK